ncbi:MAG: DUF2299 family protein [Promethearchaeota archaeon]
MSDNKINIKELIQEYLLDEGILREKLSNPKLEFGFLIAFPPGLNTGNKLNVFMPKNKDFIIISIGTQISQEHANSLNSIGEKKMHFFMSLRKLFLSKNVYFRIDAQNNRFEISDQIFLKKNGSISKNSLYKGIRKVFNTAMYANTILQEYCMGKVSQDDFTSGSDFSLYT